MKLIATSILTVFTFISMSAQTAVITEMNQFVKPRYKVIVDNDFKADPTSSF